MTTIDLTVHPERRARTIQRVQERNIIIPTFAQMKNPELERAMMEKVHTIHPEYCRLVSYYYQEDIENVTNLKEEV